eukprot:COSAG02_NODE_3646_length_6430_cov_5.383036_5_plen_101_part_00
MNHYSAYCRICRLSCLIRFIVGAEPGATTILVLYAAARAFTRSNFAASGRYRGATTSFSLVLLCDSNGSHLAAAVLRSCTAARFYTGMSDPCRNFLAVVC